MKSAKDLVAHYLKPDRGLLIVGSGALVVSAASNAYAPRAMGKVIDSFARRREQRCGAHELRRELLVTAAVFGIGAVASGLRVRMFAAVLERSLARLRRDLYRAALVRRSAFFDGTTEHGNPSELVAALEKEARVVCATYTEQVQNGARYASSILNGGASLARLNARLALELLATIPVAATLLRVAGKAVSRRAAAAAAAEARCNERAAECLTRSMRFVRAAGAEGKEWTRYAALCDEAATLGAAHGRARGAFHGLLDAVAKIAVLGVVARGGALVQSGAMTAGDLLSFSLYAGYCALGLAGFGKFAVSELASGRRSAAACSAALRVDESDRGAAALLEALPPIAVPAAEPHVQLKGVWLTYPGKHEPALRGVDLAVGRGEIRGLAGASGAGKTSIVACVLGLYDVDKGAVSVGGLDVAGASPRHLAALRSTEVALVDQAATVPFSGSLAEAIAYPDAPTKDVIDVAANLASLDVDSIGYDANIGHHAAGLSGGQRARVAVARALCRRSANLLVLDESTASLDARTEDKLLDAVFADARRRNATVLVIAHSPAVMLRCDAVSVLADGKIVQTGKYTDLAQDPGSPLAALLKQPADDDDAS